MRQTAAYALMVASALAELTAAALIVRGGKRSRVALRAHDDDGTPKGATPWGDIPVPAKTALRAALEELGAQNWPVFWITVGVATGLAANFLSSVGR